MKLFILLSLFVTSLTFAETPTKEKDVLWECGADTGMEGTVHGKYYTEYSEYTYQIFPTAKAGIFLVKEGIRDNNAGANFMFDTEWTATEFKAADGSKLYQSQKDQKVSFKVTNKNFKGSPAYKEGNASSHPGTTFRCENSPWN